MVQIAEIFHVIYNIQHGGGGALPPLPGLGATTAGVGTGGDGVITYSAEEVEKMTQNPSNETPKRFGTAEIIANGPIQIAKLVSVQADTAEHATKFVKYFLNAEVAGVLTPGTGKTEFKETPITNKEQGEKPFNTVAKTNMAATAAV